MTVFICGGQRARVRRRITCPVCKHLARIVQSFSNIWYGDTFTCCRCGDSWSDGEIRGRPFRRGWRAEAIKRAKKEWATPTATRADLDRMVKAEFEAYCSPLVEDVEAL